MSLQGLSRLFRRDDSIQLSALRFPAYLITKSFEVVHLNAAASSMYPQNRGRCPCMELLTIAEGVQVLQSVAQRQVWTGVVQERVVSPPDWSPVNQPHLIDETNTKLRCKAIVHTRMLYDLEVAGGALRSFELTCMASGDLIIVFQKDVTVRVMQNQALFRLIDLNMGLLAEIYPSRFINDILGAGERRTSLSFCPDDCKKYCEYHDNVMILFADVVGFTAMCSRMQPLEIMDLLTLLYESNDTTLRQFSSLSKLEVVGDCYVAVGGLKVSPDSSTSATANQMLDFAMALQDISQSIEDPPDGVMLRIGIHCGPVTSGIIGRTSCKFMLFGDAMNIASRMESTCPNGKIQTSADFHHYVEDSADWTHTTAVIKGKNTMDTYVHDPVSLLSPLRCDVPARAARVSMGQLDFPSFLSMQQYPYLSSSRETSWKVNLDMMLPTDCPSGQAIQISVPSLKALPDASVVASTR